MTAEYLPATGAAAQELVLLHGWGNSREIWRPLLTRLRSWATVTLLDLPGLAPGADVPEDSMDQLLEEVLTHCPGRAVYVGWSLGGLLTAEIARRHPERVAGLVTLATNPRFVADGPWPGMDPRILAEFRAAALADSAATLRRFNSLQVAGSPAARDLLRELHRLRTGAGGPAPLAGLAWLASLDLRPALPRLAMPQLHLLAGADGLVPAATEAALGELLRDVPDAAVETVPGASHLLPLEHAADLAARLRAALDAWGLQRATAVPAPPLDKRDVAVSFSRAAPRYDSVARLQHDVGAALLQRARMPLGEPKTILDLGSGTGYFCAQLQRLYPRASYLGLDLAEGMVRFARDHHPGDAAWLVADAESLPLAAESQDLIFSSLAVQWCPRPALLFAELARVLRPGGRCVFTTLGPGTLCELRAAWAEVDGHQHVNDFLPMEALRAAAQPLPGVRLQLESMGFRMEYGEVRDLLLELKTLGAHNINRRRPAGLTGRHALQRMSAAYERWRQGGALPASYEVVFGVLDKT